MSDEDNQLFIREQENGCVRVVWYLKDFEKHLFESSNSKSKPFIKSKLFKSPDN